MRKYTYIDETPILYLVATPIGNLEDMTYRAVRILNEVDTIYCEDTRTSKVLLDHYNIQTHTESYHEFNQEIKSASVLEKLKTGVNVAIISDAGLPVISDPGYKIAKMAMDEGFSVATIPGASAGISALISSGLAPMPYTFYGFLDSKKTARIHQLEELKYEHGTHIFYEAPHRIYETLEDMLEVLGDRDVVIARELTKKFEEYLRGKISEVMKEENIKGEMVLLVEGYKEIAEENVDYNIKIDELISLGMKSTQAIKEVAKKYNLDKQTLYKEYLEYKNNR